MLRRTGWQEDFTPHVVSIRRDRMPKLPNNAGSAIPFAIRDLLDGFACFAAAGSSVRTSGYERLRRSGARRDTGWFGMIEERLDKDEPSEKGH